MLGVAPHRNRGCALVKSWARALGIPKDRLAALVKEVAEQRQAAHAPQPRSVRDTAAIWLIGIGGQGGVRAAPARVLELYPRHVALGAAACRRSMSCHSSTSSSVGLGKGGQPHIKPTQVQGALDLGPTGSIRPTAPIVVVRVVASPMHVAQMRADLRNMLGKPL